MSDAHGLYHVVAEALRETAPDSDPRIVEQEIMSGGAIEAHAYANSGRRRVWIVATVESSGADLSAVRKALDYGGVWTLIGPPRVLALFLARSPGEDAAV